MGENVRRFETLLDEYKGGREAPFLLQLAGYHWMWMVTTKP